MTVKLVALVAVPPGVVTVIAPLVAPLGTVAVILRVAVHREGCGSAVEADRRGVG